MASNLTKFFLSGFPTDGLAPAVWQGGETEALARLDKHLERKVTHYLSSDSHRLCLQIKNVVLPITLFPALPSSGHSIHLWKGVFAIVGVLLWSWVVCGAESSWDSSGPKNLEQYIIYAAVWSTWDSFPCFYLSVSFRGAQTWKFSRKLFSACHTLHTVSFYLYLRYWCEYMLTKECLPLVYHLNRLSHRLALLEPLVEIIRFFSIGLVFLIIAHKANNFKVVKGGPAAEAWLNFNHFVVL